MPEYLAPGVFVEEVDTGPKPIEGVGTNTCAFIGYAKSGEFNKPTLITNWTQFCTVFGEDENKLLSALSKEVGKAPIDILAERRDARKARPTLGWLEFAREELSKARDEKKTNLDWYKFCGAYEVSNSTVPNPYREGCYLAHSVYGFFMNGGGRCYVVRIPHKADVQTLQLSGASETKYLTRVEFLGCMLTARAEGQEVRDLKVEVEPTGEANEFKLKVLKGDTVVESFGWDEGSKPLTTKDFDQRLKSEAKFVEVSGRPQRTATVTEQKTILFETIEEEVNFPAVNPAKLVGTIEDLADLEADEIVGDEARRTGAGGLEALEDLDMVCVPDLMAGVFTRPGAKNGNSAEVLSDEQIDTEYLTDARKNAILGVQTSIVGFCERGERMAILDPLPGLSPQEVKEVTLKTSWGCERGQAALYYPWIKIQDPANRKRRMFVPPCGHIAGAWAKAVNETGVHKAPANMPIIGAVALETQVTKGEQETLNPEGINCIRSFPGRGIRIWGARTLATSTNPSWKYVNVRRLFNYLEKSMDKGLQWVVFEPNDHDLWGRVRRTLSAFLWTEWKEGKLFGQTPQEAFFVKCDGETNPQEMIDLGRMYVEIGINPVKPAEFVIVRMGQWTGGSSTSEQ